MNVPFLDLNAQYASIKDEIAAALQAVLDTTAFAGGRFVEQFEQEFAAYCECAAAVGVGSGTTALWAALQACEVGAGDEVITVPNTFIATAEAVSLCGAQAVFVDVDPQTLTLNPALLEAAITPKTRAIIPVHLHGQPADMDPIMEIANAKGLVVIEDACQAHGARYKGRAAGSIGHAGCFSFYPGKNLGAYGEAGAVVTNDSALAQQMKMFRDHGQSKKYYHAIIGWNARMDGFQGAVLSVKLKYLSEWNEARRTNAQKYGELLNGTAGISTPVEADYARHVYHIYAIRTQNRDLLMAGLAENGIGCGIHYPIPLHLQDAYKHLKYSVGTFPVSEQSAKDMVSLPMFPELSDSRIEYVVETLKKLASE